MSLSGLKLQLLLNLKKLNEKEEVEKVRGAAEESSQCRTAGPCQGQLSFTEIKELPTNWGMAGRELYAKLALRVERKANMNKNSLYDAIDEHFTQNECSTPTVHSSLAVPLLPFPLPLPLLSGCDLFALRQ